MIYNRITESFFHLGYLIEIIKVATLSSIDKIVITIIYIYIYIEIQ